MCETDREGARWRRGKEIIGSKVTESKVREEGREGGKEMEI